MQFSSHFILIIVIYFFYFFFFQAEDGIRDRNVTGVQTCALPIELKAPGGIMDCGALVGPHVSTSLLHYRGALLAIPTDEIGRASCRERDWLCGVQVVFESRCVVEEEASGVS